MEPRNPGSSTGEKIQESWLLAPAVHVSPGVEGGRTPRTEPHHCLGQDGGQAGGSLGLIQCLSDSVQPGHSWGSAPVCPRCTPQRAGLSHARATSGTRGQDKHDGDTEALRLTPSWGQGGGSPAHSRRRDVRQPRGTGGPADLVNRKLNPGCHCVHNCAWAPCMCTHVCLCLHIHVCMYTCIQVCVWGCTCVQACVDVCAYPCLYAQSYAFVYTCMCMPVCTRRYASACTCLYVHLCTGVCMVHVHVLLCVLVHMYTCACLCVYMHMYAYVHVHEL